MTPSHPLTLALLTACLPLASCVPVGGLSVQDDSGAAAPSDLVLEPSRAEFGEVTLGATAQADLSLSNPGEEAVELSTLSVEGEHFALLSSYELPRALEPGEALPIRVAYEPGGEGSHGGVLIAAPADGEVVTAVLTGSGIAPRWIEEEFALDNPPVDLLFLADQSGSMQDDNARLAATFSVFIRTLETVSSDWRIMVVNDDDGCSRGGVLTPETPGYEAIFQADIRSGGGAYTEALLTLAALALDHSGAGECNDGFLREEALLHVVMTSDEPEQSPRSWGTYLEAMQAHKPYPQQLRISAVAGDYPGGCGGASAGVGYYEAVLATEGAFLSICDDWTDNVDLLAEASAWQWRLDLEVIPVVETLQLWVNDEQRSEGFHYDPELNAVLIDTVFPKPSNRVTVAYEEAAR
jgi:hypothetical protein